MKNWLYLLLAAAALISDQLSKRLILSSFTYGVRHPVIPAWFDLTLVYNKGIAFSLFADNCGWTGYAVAALALLVCAYMTYCIIKDKFTAIQKTAGALIAAGALGNIIDRCLYGHVIDFILLYHQNYSYPVFNLADSFITLGAVIFISDGLFNRHNPAKPYER